MSLPNEGDPGDNRGPSEENEHPPNEDHSSATESKFTLRLARFAAADPDLYATCNSAVRRKADDLRKPATGAIGAWVNGVDHRQANSAPTTATPAAGAEWQWQKESLTGSAG